MEISGVKVRKAFEDGTMRAIVSVTFDNQIAVHDIKVIYAGERYFIVMPSRKVAENSFRDIVHPINSEFRAKLEKAVIDAYFEQKDALLDEARAAAEAAQETTEE
jgi:stage V sporulation protein G